MVRSVASDSVRRPAVSRMVRLLDNAPRECYHAVRGALDDVAGDRADTRVGAPVATSEHQQPRPDVRSHVQHGATIGLDEARMMAGAPPNGESAISTTCAPSPMPRSRSAVPLVADEPFDHVAVAVAQAGAGILRSDVLRRCVGMVKRCVQHGAGAPCADRRLPRTPRRAAPQCARGRVSAPTANA
jgi:hypothetical protein